jgi:hypothetical protein
MYVRCSHHIYEEWNVSACDSLPRSCFYPVCGDSVPALFFLNHPQLRFSTIYLHVLLLSRPRPACLY